MIQQTIKELTPTAVARAMDLPISTVFRWMKEDRIPGDPKHAGYKWRVEQFEAAVKKLRVAKRRRAS